MKSGLFEGQISNGSEFIWSLFAMLYVLCTGPTICPVFKWHSNIRPFGVWPFEIPNWFGIQITTVLNSHGAMVLCPPSVVRRISCKSKQTRGIFRSDSY